MNRRMKVLRGVYLGLLVIVSSLFLLDLARSQGGRPSNVDRSIGVHTDRAPTSSNSLVTFNAFPAHLQLFPRERDDSAVVDINGIALHDAFKRIQIELYKNNVLSQTQERILSFDGGVARFSFELKIHAELVEYKFVALLKSEIESVAVDSADSVVCGDAFLITGQSNSHWGEPEATYKNEFCRSFGFHTDVHPYDSADTSWGLSTGYKMPRGIGGPHDGHFVGVLGLRLQQLIADSFRIPTCILNGGSGGSFIHQNLPNAADNSDLNTTYGRLLYRATKAKLQDRIKAILWHQGESDSEPSWKGYFQNFTALYDAWKQDYSPLPKIYVFQVRPGCSDAYDYPSKLREVQRNLPRHYPDISLMSTVGIPGHDGCHFSYAGYIAMANQIFRLIARDFYAWVDTTDIDPPNIARAYFSTSKRDELTIEFDKCRTLIWPDDTLGESLKDYFYLDNQHGHVRSSSIQGNKLYLTLNGSSDATTVSYLPPRFYNHRNEFYEGPFLTNRKGVGALTFYQYAIGGASTILEYQGSVGRDIKVRPCYPNPFNNSTKIRFNLNFDATVNVSVYDITGRKVKVLLDSFLTSGDYVETVEVSDLSTGIYTCVVNAGGMAKSAKLLLLK